jgi:predicted ATPase
MKVICILLLTLASANVLAAGDFSKDYLCKKISGTTITEPAVELKKAVAQDEFVSISSSYIENQCPDRISFKFNPSSKIDVAYIRQVATGSLKYCHYSIAVITPTPNYIVVMCEPVGQKTL